MPGNMRIHTVGVGEECDQILLKEVAMEGRGHFTLMDNIERMNKDAELALMKDMH